jgi:hypothetical protein
VSDAPAVAPLVSATSVMLAAFGFFYNTQRDLLVKAADLTKSTSTTENKARAKTALRAARTCVVLALAAAVPAGLLTPEVVREIRRAADLGFDLDHYSTLDVVFVVLALSWWVLVLTMLFGCRRHLVKARTLASDVGRWRHLIWRPA